MPNPLTKEESIVYNYDNGHLSGPTTCWIFNSMWNMSNLRHGFFKIHPKYIVYYARQSSFGFSRNIATLNYNPNSRNVGTFFKIWIKWKLKDFQITWANILFTIEHIEHNKCLNWGILHFYPLNELVFFSSTNFMLATSLKKSWHGATKGWKSKKLQID